MLEAPNERGIYQAEGLTSATLVAKSVMQMLEVLGEKSPAALPLPSNPQGLAPCDIIVTEWNHPSGVLLGRVRFVHPNGADLFNQIWQISDSKSAQ
jgi:hypothetical protein